MELHTKTVETSNQDVAMGDIFLESCLVRTAYLRRPPAAPKLTGKLRLDQIVIDAEKPAADVQVRPPGGLPPTNFKPGSTKLPRCWTGPSLDRRSEWESLCSVEFGRYLSIESFVGGSVKLIRVVRYGEYATPNLTPSEIKNKIQKVWFGLFDTAYCHIPWAEMNDWNIEASVEFEDGKRTSLLTDGGHVEVEDREGKHWFIRLGD